MKKEKGYTILKSPDNFVYEMSKGEVRKSNIGDKVMEEIKKKYRFAGCSLDRIGNFSQINYIDWNYL